MRTALFVPGNRPDRVDKAVNAGADAVIIDLEDAVAMSEKADTRPIVREKLLTHRDKRMIVRVNGLDSGLLHDDLAQVLVENLACIMIPKVDDPDHIREIHRLLLTLEKEKGIQPGNIGVIPLIETAKAVQNIFRIVSEKTEPSRVCTVAFGAADFTLDMGTEITREGTELIYPRSRIPIACRAAGIAPPIDTPFMIDLKDLDALKADATKAKQLGFQGKLCIHPNQIKPCHEVFSPTKEEISYAERVISAFDKAEAEGVAAIQLDGRFIDYPVVEKARRIMSLAEITEN
ncbi:MAG: CoA ester lyase [Deltaproteobacteria bacterium]|nr:CoA ester lyase [Deltaproteobacteria bacterium]